MTDTLVNLAIAAEVVIALVLVWLDYREARFLNGLRPLKGDEWLPLFDALDGRATYVTLVGAYLLLLTAFGAAGYQIADVFPPIRAINGALLLGLLAGPLVVGRAMRKVRASSEEVADHAA